MNLETIRWNASDIAVFLLAMVGGFSLASVFKSCAARIVLAVTIVAIIILALIRGHSQGIETITASLTYYIRRNPIGILGFVLGFVVSLVVMKKGR
jgi:hypothetical protein